MLEPRSRYLWVCTKARSASDGKPSCGNLGAEELTRQLKSATIAARLDVRVAKSGCIDMCDAGPVVAIMPDHVILERVSLDAVPRIVDAIARVADSTSPKPLCVAAEAVSLGGREATRGRGQ